MRWLSGYSDGKLKIPWKKVAEKFGLYWIFVVPLQPQTGNGATPWDPGATENEFIEMIAIDKEQWETRKELPARRRGGGSVTESTSIFDFKVS